MDSVSSMRSLLATLILFGSLGASAVVSAISSSPAIQANDDAAPANADQPVNAKDASEQKVEETTGRESDTGTAIPAPNPAAPVQGANEAADINFDSKGRTWGVHLSSDGLLAGRLNLADPVSGVRIPAQNLTIRFIQNGKVVSQAKPGVAGVFQAQGLKAGRYSLVASGTDGYLATGVRVLPPLTANDSERREPFQIDVDIVGPVNAPLVRTMIRERKFPGTKKGLNATHDQNLDAKTVGRPLRTPVLSLDPQGHLHVRLHRINRTTGEREFASGVEAVLIRDGIITAKSKINDRGIFTFPDLDAGNYALLVTPSVEPEQSTKLDRAGFAAMGVIVREHVAPVPRVVERRGTATIRLVSRVLIEDETQDKSEVDDADIPDLDEVPAEDLEAADSDAAGESAADATVGAPATSGGGGGGGGGGAGGGFLAGALIGGAVAGGIVAAVASPGIAN